MKMTGPEPGSGGGSPKPPKRIALDVKPAVLGCFEANEKLRHVVEALGISLEAFRIICEARGRGEACELPDSWFGSAFLFLVVLFPVYFAYRSFLLIVLVSHSIAWVLFLTFPYLPPSLLPSFLI